MSKELVKQSAEVSTVTPEILSGYLDSMGLAQKLNDREKNQFLQIAQAYGLNPFKREIYVTKYEGGADSFSVIVGFETYIKRAERSGKLDGWDVEFSGSGNDLSCTVTIYRKDWTRPFKHTAWYEEAVQTTRDGKVTKFWKKARTMTRKVAISQAFRLAFPDENGGLPYTNDELGIEDTTYSVVEETPTVNQAQPAPAKRDNSKRIAGYIASIEKTSPLDNTSFNFVEKTIFEDADLTIEEKRPVVKEMFLKRLDGVVNVETATDYRKGLGRWFKAGVMLESDATALQHDLIEQASAYDVEFDGKVFTAKVYNEPTADELTQALAENG